MVLRVLNFNFRAASCCNVLVVNGGRGFEVFGFSSTFDTINFSSLRSAFIFSTCSLFSRTTNLFLFIFSFVEAQTPYEKGQELYKSRVCYKCHGHRLEGMNNFPYLANRAKGYMSYKLKRFRSKQADTQAQEMMITYSVGLSDADIDNLTTFMYEYVDEESAERYDDSYQVSGDGGS